MSYSPPPPSEGWPPPAGEPSHAQQGPWPQPGNGPWPQPGSGPWQQPGQFGTTPEERNWAMAAHVGSLAAAIVLGLALLAPLIVMLTKGNESAFVRRHAVEALNFQITALIAGIVSGILVFVGIGVLLFLLLVPFWLIVVIMGTVAASNGREFRYPLSLRLVS